MLPRSPRRRSSRDTARAVLVLLWLAGPPLVANDEPPGAFTAATTCATCHSTSPHATALKGADGSDASPYGLWRATVMANSFRDPIWRAQVAREVAEHGGRATEIEALCLTCHGPMVHHESRLIGRSAPSIADAARDPLARDGVSCTVCHQVQADGLGAERTFDGRPVITSDRRIFGPYPEPFAHPMRMHTGYTPEHGAHVSESALCGSCHTLRTSHAPGADAFLEQSPYLEWRNSRFSDEDGPTEGSRTCQACHMTDMGSMRIARNPGGRDFPPVRERPHVRGHAWLGGNTLLLELFAEHSEELGVAAPAGHFRQLAEMTRRQLGRSSARLQVDGLSRDDARLRFDVRVVNLTGHKLPTGYPARRAWLEVVVHAGDVELFRSGSPDAEGRITPAGAARGLPHVTRVERPEQLVVYELVAADAEGRPTTSLLDMAGVLKDSRLLPEGWRPDGPHGAATAPIGLEDDKDFTGGSDVVSFELPLPPAVDGELRVHARLLYQTLPPAWRDDLVASDTTEARRFAKLLAGAGRPFEVLAEASAVAD